MVDDIPQKIETIDSLIQWYEIVADVTTDFQSAQDAEMKATTLESIRQDLERVHEAEAE